MTSQELFALAEKKKQEEDFVKANLKPQVAKLKEPLYSGEYLADILESDCMHEVITQKELNQTIEKFKRIGPVLESGAIFRNSIDSYGRIKWKPENMGYYSFDENWAKENLEIIE